MSAGASFTTDPPRGAAVAATGAFDAPIDEAGVAAALRAAHDAAEPVLVRGAGTKLGMLRPVQAARTLSTTGLTGITLYSPQELVLSARAGTPIAELEAAVAAKGQQITAEPPDFSALLGSTGAQTLGGVVAANLSGPRRVAWGAMRDHVLGLRAVNGMGEVIRSGGRVLKNVTGLDLAKLLTGSHGTLGVITEVTFKVLPVAEQRATLLLPGLDPVRGVAALSAALGSPYGISAAAYLPAGMAARIPALAGIGQPVALVRLEDFASFVAYRSERLRSDLAEFGAAEMLDDATTRAVWTAVRDATPLVAEPGAIWRVSVRPSQGPRVAAVLERMFGARWFLDWGGGLVWVSGPATAAAHQAVVTAVQEAGGTWTLLRAPEALRTAVEVIPPEPPALAAIARRVKAAFDPKGILNPGRMRAGF
ncbi:Glycolate dehydrogenase, FAD-binding subunit GlcE [Rhodovastum atsumiense]|uniref:FAD-binding protein n=1 Tax=Rhodovastum atsumiense TaxID=504468 RepID=A0A5M6J1G5_9PROT|nr:FAD-binding protein [Rhodovastum atsumiense]KAA5614344.1 FAD-binding protein [Rhodovastum atsumiense]CAH2604813.1 Glycolate dehydrogenase, FAD-binding subunit GlcE [Rhodovastum atsumiense]